MKKKKRKKKKAILVQIAGFSEGKEPTGQIATQRPSHRKNPIKHFVHKALVIREAAVKSVYWHSTQAGSIAAPQPKEMNEYMTLLGY